MTNKKLKKLRSAIRASYYNWWDLNRGLDKLRLTEAEYLELCKFAINLYPDQIAHVRDDKMSDADYYAVCKVMASHGVVINEIKYEKLKRDNAVYDIWATALLNKQGYFDGRTTIFAIKAAQEKFKYLSPRDYAKVCLIMYLKFPGKISQSDICDMYNHGLLADSDVEFMTQKIIEFATMDFYEPFSTAVNAARRYDAAFGNSVKDTPQNTRWLKALRDAQFKILSHKIQYENNIQNAIIKMSKSHSK